LGAPGHGRPPEGCLKPRQIRYMPNEVFLFDSDPGRVENLKEDIRSFLGLSEPLSDLVKVNPGKPVGDP